MLARQLLHFIIYDHLLPAHSALCLTSKPHQDVICNSDNWKLCNNFFGGRGWSLWSTSNFLEVIDKKNEIKTPFKLNHWECQTQKHSTSRCVNVWMYLIQDHYEGRVILTNPLCTWCGMEIEKTLRIYCVNAGHNLKYKWDDSIHPNAVSTFQVAPNAQWK